MSDASDDDLMFLARSAGSLDDTVLCFIHFVISFTHDNPKHIVYLLFSKI